MSAIITLTTDFGVFDSYVAQMKGEILKIAPEARIVDVTHDIPPQDIRRGAIMLREIVASFPPDTIHLAVVDPGVGSEQRAVAVEMAEQRFVGPDNGLFGLVARDWPPRRIARLDRPTAWRMAADGQPPSHTFHGRDIFAPVAARWSLGADLETLGTLTAEPLYEIAWPEPRVIGRQIVGEVVAIDRFGNLITNLHASRLSASPPEAWEFTFAEQHLRGLRRCYSEVAVQQALALIGSSGFLELAVRDGDAADRFGVRVGDKVTCQPREETFQN